MARLPTPGSDTGNWGNILNEYLATSHNPDGTNFGPVYFVENFGAKGDGESDDTKAINDCFDAAAKTGGTVAFQAKNYRFTSLNFTGASCVTIQGVRGASVANPQKRVNSQNQTVEIGTPATGEVWSGMGTILWPLPGAATRNLIDLSGSGKITLKDLQIGIGDNFKDQAQVPVCGILIGHVDGFEEGEFLFENVYITGRFSQAALYYGGTLSTFVNCQFYNYVNTACCISITKGNFANVVSDFVTLSTNPWYGSETIFLQCQFHELSTNSQTFGVRFDGANEITFEHLHATASNFYFVIDDTPRAQSSTRRIRIVSANMITPSHGVLTIKGSSTQTINGLEFVNISTVATNYFLRIENALAKIKSLRINGVLSTNDIAIIASDSTQEEWLSYSYVEATGLTIAANASISASNVIFGAGQVRLPVGKDDLSKKL